MFVSVINGEDKCTHYHYFMIIV